MIKLTEEDKIFVEYIINPQPITEEQFEHFWTKNGYICELFGYDKESYRKAIDNTNLDDRRCENCVIFKNDECKMIKEFFESHRYVSLVWIFSGNNCSKFKFSQ